MKRQRIVAIDIKNASKQFDDSSYLFRDLNLSFLAGENVALEGAAGSGKSILLRILAGLIEPTEGDVYYNNMPLKEMSFEQFNPLRMSTAFCFENGGLLMNRTIQENLKVALIYHKQWRSERSQRLFHELVEHFDIKKFLDLRPSSVSPGVRKIAGLVRVFLSNSQIMFLDEPTLGVGEAGREALATWLKRWAEIKKKDENLFVASSDRAFVSSLNCKRFILDDGQVNETISGQKGEAA